MAVSSWGQCLRKEISEGVIDKTGLLRYEVIPRIGAPLLNPGVYDKIGKCPAATILNEPRSFFNEYFRLLNNLKNLSDIEEYRIRYMSWVLDQSTKCKTEMLCPNCKKSPATHYLTFKKEGDQKGRVVANLESICCRSVNCKNNTLKKLGGSHYDSDRTGLYPISFLDLPLNLDDQELKWIVRDVFKPAFGFKTDIRYVTISKYEAYQFFENAGKRLVRARA